MEITSVDVKKIKSENRMKAVANITIDNAFAIHDIKVIEPTDADKPLFIAMPSKKTPKGEWKDIAHPINSETRNLISEAILAKYNSLPDDAETTTTEEEA